MRYTRIPIYFVQHNDCRLCLYGRKPNLWERLVKKYTPDWRAAVCTSPKAIVSGCYPIDHGENEHLPCRLYKER